AGPALVISFLLAGCAGAFAALSYAELASMIPIAGSAYSYAYATLGELAAWFIGWNLVLEYTFSVGTVAIGWSAYVVSLLAQFGIHLPEALIQADRKSTRLNSSHVAISYAVFCLKKKKKK